MCGPEPEQSAAQRVIARCREQGWSIATAESLTGGLAAAELISVPGASDVVHGGVIAYATEIKQRVLGVPPELLHVHGTVSSWCAHAMAAGACEALRSTFGLATTGVAGPDPSEGWPPGTVHLAVCGRVAGREEVRAHRAFTTRGSRDRIRAEAAAAGVSLLLDTLNGA